MFAALTTSNIWLIAVGTVEAIISVSARAMASNETADGSDEPLMEGRVGEVTPAMSAVL